MYEYKAKVSSVYDGDTLRMDVDLGFKVWLFDVPFRLNRIQAPELSKLNNAGEVARRYLVGVAPLGSQILIKTEKDKQEKYGRYLADLYLVNGECINDNMTKMGFAVYWDGQGPKPLGY